MRHIAKSLILLGLLLTRFSHLDIVWVEEGYPAAAAIQLLHGKQLYREIWFDKPPLFPYFYLLWGGYTGWPMRLAGVGFVFSCCLLMYKMAADLWGEREGIAAASFLAFYLTFGIPSAVMALAPDLLLIAPHILAIWMVSGVWGSLLTCGRLPIGPFAAGLIVGVGTLVNTKSVFILAACLLWTGRAWPMLLLGFVLPNAAAFAWFGQPYVQQVWAWGAVYSRYGFSAATGLVRTSNWIGFHSAIVLASFGFFWKQRSWRWLGWVLLAAVAVAAGWRFFPRYYFQLLVPVVLTGARGFVLLDRKRWVILALLVIPLARFGPRYVTLGFDLLSHRPHQWSDLQLFDDSQQAANLLTDRRATLLVWGYRPDIFALTRMQAGTRFLDSQPLTGVIADRHLTNSEVSYPELAAQSRRELVTTHPDYIVDGLGSFNPALAIAKYPDLREWLSNYHEVGRTHFSIVYRRF